MTAVNRQSGSALVMALLVLGALTAVAAAWAQFAARQSHAVIDQAQEEEAFAISEAGLQYALWLLNGAAHTPDSLVAGGTIVMLVTGDSGDEAGRYELTFNGGGSSVAVTSVGYDVNLTDRCQQIDAVINSYGGVLSGTQYYVRDFDHRLSTVCGPLPPERGPGAATGGPAPGTVLFDDPFTENANTTLASHTPNSVGSGWSVLLTKGRSDSSLRIQSSGDYLRREQCGSNDGVLYQARDPLLGADYDVSVRQVRGDTGHDYNFLAARIRDSGNFYAAKWNESNAASQPGLYKWSGGTAAPLGPRLSGSIADGSNITLRVQGSTISFLVNGVVRLSVADATFSAAGRAGLGMGALTDPTDDCSSQRLDDFRVVAL